MLSRRAVDSRTLASTFFSCPPNRDAGADVTQADDNGWTALHAASCNGSGRSASCALALLKAGAAVDAEFCDPDDAVSLGRVITPLLVDTFGHSHSRVIPVLLRYGADLDRARPFSSRQPPNKLYLERVHAAGGWKRYAQAHRLRLTKTFARVVFPSVPEELVAHIVGLWAHVGYY